MVESVNNDYLLIPLTKEETEHLDNFKIAIQKENLIFDSNVINNNYLIRFLRARKYKIDKTIDMFKKYLKWREEIKIDEIIKMEFPEEAELLSYYPQGLHKTDKDGRPIYYELLGRLNLEQILKITSFERLFSYNIKNLEYYLSEAFPASSKAIGKNVSQFFSIIDLKGFSAKLLSKKVYEYLKNTLTATQNYYPEMLGQMYIINSNLVFKACWTVIKAFLDDKTKGKIIFVGKDYKKKLLKHVSFLNF